MTALSSTWPIAIVTGFLGSGKTTLIGQLLRRPDMSDTAVIVNEFGEVGLDHNLIKAATDTVMLMPNGCLCCSIRQDIVQTLRELYTSWLTGEVPNFRRVIIETTGLAEPAPLVASVGCHPLLAEVFALQSIVTLVDAEHGLARQASSVTNRNQICLADRLLISKCDLVEVRAIEALERRLATLNPLAPICRGDRGVNPDFLFTGTAAAMAMSNLRCDRVFDHLAGISSLLLRPEQPLAWPAFQIWLHDLLNQYGSRIMRIKGQLAFEGCPAPLIIQAVHHTFYPIVEAQVAEDGAASDNFLVVVFEGDMPQELEDAMSWLSAAAAG